MQGGADGDGFLPAHAAVDGYELTLPVSRWLPADPRGIPSGPPSDVTGTPFDFRAARPVGAVALDHAFTGLERDEAGLAWARLTSDGAGAALWAGPATSGCRRSPETRSARRAAAARWPSSR